MEKKRSFYIVSHGNAESAFELREEPVPDPQAGSVRIRVEGFGINFADIMARKGLYQDAPPLPCVVGYEVVGQAMDDFEVDDTLYPEGTRVVAFTRFGGYSTHVLAQSQAVQPIPDDIPLGEALALAVQFCTAYHCVEERVHVFEEDNVLVQAAAGGVGIAMVQLLARKGCTIFGTAGSEEKLKLIRENGVHHPINYRSENFAEVVSDKLNGRGLDVVFDSLGGKSFSNGFKCLASGGRIVELGAAEQVDKGFQLLNQLKLAKNFGLFSPIQLLMNSKAIIGVNMLRIADERPEVLARTMKSVVELWRRKEIKPVVGKVFSSDALIEAHNYVELRKSVGKVVIQW